MSGRDLVEGNRRLKNRLLGCVGAQVDELLLDSQDVVGVGRQDIENLKDWYFPRLDGGLEPFLLDLMINVPMPPSACCSRQEVRGSVEPESEKNARAALWSGA